MEVIKRKATGELKKILDKFNSLPPKEQQRMLVNTAMQMEREATIDHACQWLKCKYDDIGLQWMRGVNVSDVIDDFRSELEKI